MTSYLPIPNLTVDQLKNFWARVIIKGPNDCWPWIGVTIKKGYGRFSVSKHSYLATRIMLALNGKYNNQLECCHSCNNPNCVNPKHLRFGTLIENQHDRIAAGTTNQGQRCGMSKLSDKDILQILKLCKTKLQKDIAREYGISSSQISKITTGKQWRHIVVAKRIPKVKYHTHLTLKDIIAIRCLCKTRLQKDVAHMYGVSHQHISRIVNGYTCKI